MRALALAVSALLFLATSAGAGRAGSWTLFFEALPATGLTLTRLADAPYAERLALARRTAAEIVPEVTAILDLSATTSDIATAPGGWRLATAPSLRAEVCCGEAAARRLSAALGYVLRQTAVLAADLRDAGGGTAYGIVALPPGPADPALTQRFFLHAARTDQGLADGYSTIGRGMLFLNVRDPAGRPFGGLADGPFLDALRRAAASFGDTDVGFTRSGNARVMFIANDWQALAAGEDYRRLLDAASIPALDRAATRHQAIVAALAARFGWR